MIFLDFLAQENEPWIDLAINCRKNTVAQLRAISVALKGSYDIYRQTITDSSRRFNASSFSASKELLIDYYTSPPKGLQEVIRERRNDHGLAECPYCGYPFAPDTLDHFIPKEHWPEYSIYSNNLIPQCRGCAPIKGAWYLCPDEDRPLFMHPMYSCLLSRIGFKVNIQVVNNIPLFECMFASAVRLAPEDRAAVLRHLRKLKVKSRFESYCRHQYTLWKDRASAARFDIRVAFRQRLDEMPCQGDFSPNWKRAFLLGALACQPFIESFESFAPRHGRMPNRSFSLEPPDLLGL